MTIFDSFFYTIFSYYKPRFKQKANRIALLYSSFFQIALCFMLVCFFAAFFSQMHYSLITQEKTIILFIIVALFIHFKNWIKYNGKTRKILNAKFNKRKTAKHNILLLLALPFLSIIMGLLFLQAL